jgi:methylated-DNA-[protein]-cysteine S-methyltransferase
MQLLTYDSNAVKCFIAVENGAVIAISDKVLTADVIQDLKNHDCLDIPGDTADNVLSQLDDYFKGKRKRFSVHVKLYGTDFQRKVWEACASIPYGETRSYGELAAMIGNPKAMRAVGSALGRNPVPIIIPCHRVLQSNGTLGGFGWGLEAKEYFIDLEKM